jgi:hypothetical protein
MNWKDSSRNKMRSQTPSKNWMEGEGKISYENRISKITVRENG